MEEIETAKECRERIRERTDRVLHEDRQKGMIVIWDHGMRTCQRD